jgi:hypothetical protein
MRIARFKAVSNKSQFPSSKILIKVISEASSSPGRGLIQALGGFPGE